MYIAEKDTRKSKFALFYDTQQKMKYINQYVYIYYIYSIFIFLYIHTYIHKNL